MEGCRIRMKMKIKKILGGVLAVIGVLGIATAAEKGPTIVVKKRVS